MLNQLLDLLPRPLKIFGERFDRTPLQSEEELTHFVRTRSAYIAQTALYGYLKERMGTRFVELFQDTVFSASIRKSAVNLFVSCLGDLTVFAVAHAAEQARARGAGNLDAETAASVAEACFRTALAAGIEDKDRDLVPKDAIDTFKARLAATHWANAGVDDGDFQRSCEDLVRFAPVIDEFKELDREIVLNSMRFRWVDIRKQLRNRLDGVALVTTWSGLDNRNA